MLLLLAYLEDVGVSIAVQGVHGEFIFKEHGEGFDLEREVNVNTLAVGFSNLIHEFF
jgi:hypothetical protein